jgi:transcription-repair coupling factor (superfamily II helicase)
VPSPSDRFALESALARSTVGFEEAARRLRGSTRLDYAGLAGGALPLLLTEAARRGAPPMLIITPDADGALGCAADLRFFGVSGAAGKGPGPDHREPEDALPVLRFPVPDATPFLQVAVDRKASMERVAALCHLAHGLPWQFLVAPVAALLRRVAPREALRARARQIRVSDIVDRQELLELLADCGYLRVPVVEDPGSFAARGALLDVYAPHAEGPVRIELDDELVASIKQFDPDSQRATRALDHVFVHPARQTLWDAGTKQRARERISDLCDSFNLPSRKRSELLEELDAGRNVLGIDAFLPAFYERLDTLFDYLPADLR